MDRFFHIFFCFQLKYVGTNLKSHLFFVFFVFFWITKIGRWTRKKNRIYKFKYRIFLYFFLSLGKFIWYDVTVFLFFKLFSDKENNTSLFFFIIDFEIWRWLFFSCIPIVYDTRYHNRFFRLYLSCIRYVGGQLNHFS